MTVTALFQITSKNVNINDPTSMGNALFSRRGRLAFKKTVTKKNYLARVPLNKVTKNGSRISNRTSAALVKRLDGGWFLPMRLQTRVFFWLPNF